MKGCFLVTLFNQLFQKLLFILKCVLVLFDYCEIIMFIFFEFDLMLFCATFTACAEYTLKEILNTTQTCFFNQETNNTRTCT